MAVAVAAAAVVVVAGALRLGIPPHAQEDLTNTMLVNLKAGPDARDPLRVRVLQSALVRLVRQREWLLERRLRLRELQKRPKLHLRPHQKHLKWICSADLAMMIFLLPYPLLRPERQPRNQQSP